MYFLLLSTAEDMDGKTEEEIEMMKMMGFSNFNTTKVSKSCALCGLTTGGRCMPQRMFNNDKVGFMVTLVKFLHLYVVE